MDYANMTRTCDLCVETFTTQREWETSIAVGACLTSITFETNPYARLRWCRSAGGGAGGGDGVRWR